MPDSRDHDVVHGVGLVEHDQVGREAFVNSAPVVQAQDIGNVAGECRQDIVERQVLREQRGKGLRKAVGPADIHMQHLALLIEDRQAAAAIRTHGYAPGWRIGFDVSRQCDVRGPGILAFLDRKRGDIDRTSLAGERERFVEQALAAIDVSRVEYARRQFRLIQRAADEIQPALAVAEVGAAVLDQVLPGLWRGLAHGPADLLHAARPPGTPWALVVLLGGLGLVGPGLAAWLRPDPEGRGAARAHLATGLALAALGAAVVPLAAVGAPERYTNDLAPVAALLLARGAGGLALALGRLLPAPRARPLAELLAPLALVALALPRLDRPSPEPGDTAVGLHLLGRAVAEHLPPGTPVAVAAREVAVVADRPWCSWPLCSREDPGSQPARCMERIRQVCGDGGPLGWVSLPGWRLWGAQNDELVALDAWLAEAGPAEVQVSRGSFRAELRLLPGTD